MKKEKKPVHTYVLRKVVKATSVSDALKKEKDVAPMEVILVIEASKENQLIPAIGFAPREPRPAYDD